MATANFRFHGELAEFLPGGKRGGAFAHACARAATIKNAIEVFPWHAADAAADETPLFIADAHLGGLARLLRMLGFDTLFENAYADRHILALLARERRILLTRDRELLKCRDVSRGCFVRALKAEAQLNEVAARYALAQHARPFTLCLHCNARLEAAEPDAVAARVPEPIAARYTRFARCPGCSRVYWEGSHWEHMRAMLGPVLAEAAPR
ncbi:MAG: Mut7-C RNAse domain-containing protein [Burkholderiales bacterium]